MAAEKFLVTLTTNDITNLIAFGNRATMKGAEADTWVELKHRLVEATKANEREPGDRLDELENLESGVPGIDGLEDLKPGGTA